MKILKSLHNGEVKLEVTCLDDLWALSQVIEAGDFVAGRTLRKVQVQSKDERQTDAQRRPVWIKIRVDSVEFHKYSSVLRVGGEIVEAPDEIPHAHHTFNFEIGTVATVYKNNWLKFQVARLSEASKEKSSDIVICVFDRDEATFALLLEQGFKLLAKIRGEVEKKALKNESKNFYREIIKLLEEYDKRYLSRNIILASPSFWKDELLKELGNNELRKKLIMASCSSVDRGIDEVLKGDELKQVLLSERTAIEARLLEGLLLEISRQGLAAYGDGEVKNAVSVGAVKSLLVTDGKIQSLRQDGKFSFLERLMRDVEQQKGEIFIFNSDNDPGRRLDGLGGLAGLLRFKIAY